MPDIDLKEGDACPLCGKELEFSPLGECTCWSGAGTSSWSPGPCRPCENGGLFCKKCALFIDEIKQELLGDGIVRAFRGIGEVISKERPNIERRQREAIVMARALHHHQAVPGLRAFEPFWLRKGK